MPSRAVVRIGTFYDHLAILGCLFIKSSRGAKSSSTSSPIFHAREPVVVAAGIGYKAFTAWETPMKSAFRIIAVSTLTWEDPIFIVAVGHRTGRPCYLEAVDV